MIDSHRTDPHRSAVRAVIDTSTLVSVRYRHRLYLAASTGTCTVIWSPWIIAELNRVLTWRWIARHGGDASASSQQRCADAAKTMMTILLATFDLVAPQPPYPTPWNSLTDIPHIPISAAAKTGGADFVVSENRRDYPPATAEGKHIYESVEYLSANDFLAMFVNRPVLPESPSFRPDKERIVGPLIRGSRGPFHQFATLETVVGREPTSRCSRTGCSRLDS